MFDGISNPDAEAPPSGLLSRVKSAIGQPFAAPVTWGRLFLIVGFIIVCLIAWRQIINYVASDK